MAQFWARCEVEPRSMARFSRRSSNPTPPYSVETSPTLDAEHGCGFRSEAHVDECAREFVMDIGMRTHIENRIAVIGRTGRVRAPLTTVKVDELTADERPPGREPSTKLQ